MRRTGTATSSTAAAFTSDQALDLYVTGIQNAHALEQQAMQLMERQLDRLESYPEVKRVLQTHLRETEEQIRRLQEMLDAFGESRSLLKDFATSVSGNMAAIAH